MRCGGSTVGGVDPDPWTCAHIRPPPLHQARATAVAVFLAVQAKRDVFSAEQQAVLDAWVLQAVRGDDVVPSPSLAAASLTCVCTRPCCVASGAPQPAVHRRPLPICSSGA